MASALHSKAALPLLEDVRSVVPQIRDIHLVAAPGRAGHIAVELEEEGLRGLHPAEGGLVGNRANASSRSPSTSRWAASAAPAPWGWPVSPKPARGRRRSMIVVAGESDYDRKVLQHLVPALHPGNCPEWWASGRCSSSTRGYLGVHMPRKGVRRLPPVPTAAGPGRRLRQGELQRGPADAGRAARHRWRAPADFGGRDDAARFPAAAGRERPGDPLHRHAPGLGEAGRVRGHRGHVSHLGRARTPSTCG